MAKRNTRAAVAKPAAHAIEANHAAGTNGRPSSETMMHRRVDRALAQRFGIGETNLARRREFVRLAEDDRQLLMRLQSWAADAAPDIAREFYDWQFEFSPTRAFFEDFAFNDVRMLAGRIKANLFR